MRGLIRAASLALLFGAIAAGSASAQTAPKLGFVNSSAILAQAPGRAEAEAKFKSEVTAYEAQLQRMSDSLQTMAAAFERESPTLAANVREARAKVIRDRETEYQQRAQQLNEQMQNRQAELIRPIMEQVQQVIETIRLEGSYAIIFDVAGQGGSPIVAADKSLDVTEAVLTKLKAAPRPASSTGSVNPRPAGVTR